MDQDKEGGRGGGGVEMVVWGYMLKLSFCFNSVFSTVTGTELERDNIGLRRYSTHVSLEYRIRGFS